MSAMKHPTLTAWQRQENGSYAAEIGGWALTVRWHPERPHEHRGFTWTAERGGTKLAGDEIYEEIEVAMGHAEAEAEEASGPTEPAAGVH